MVGASWIGCRVDVVAASASTCIWHVRGVASAGSASPVVAIGAGSCCSRGVCSWLPDRWRSDTLRHCRWSPARRLTHHQLGFIMSALETATDAILYGQSAEFCLPPPPRLNQPTAAQTILCPIDRRPVAHSSACSHSAATTEVARSRFIAHPRLSFQLPLLIR